MKNDKVNFDIFPKSNEEYISVAHGCIRIIDIYRSLSISLDSSVKTLVDISHKTLKDLTEEIVDNSEILNMVNKRKVLVKEDKCKIVSIKYFKRDYSVTFNELGEALLNYMGEKDLKLLKTEFPDKWKSLTKKLAYAYEYFKTIDDYQKPVDNLKKENFFNELKNDYPSDKEIGRTKEIIEVFDIKNGEELTDFEADTEKDISRIGNKTTNLYKQNPVFKGYHIESEL